jgi:hypothetical protein
VFSAPQRNLAKFVGIGYPVARFNEPRGVIVEQPLHRLLVGGEGLDVEPVFLGAQREELSMVEVFDGAQDRGLVSNVRR